MRTALLLLVLCLAPAWADEFTVDELSRQEGVLLRANNRTDFLLTVHLAVQLEGAVASKNPVILVLQPHQSLEAVSIQARNEKWDYRYTFHWRYGDYRASTARHAYRLPFQKGQSYEVTQGFNGPFTHFGEQAYAVDFGLPEGTPVVAARQGRVVKVKSDSDQGGPSPEYEDQANYVSVIHSDGSLADYVHLKFGGVVVKPGQRVKAGELLGYSGSTGQADGPHLHFRVYRPLADGLGSESLPIKFRVFGHPTAKVPVAGQRYSPY